MEKEIKIGDKIYEIHEASDRWAGCRFCDLSTSSCISDCRLRLGLSGYLKEKKSMQNEVKIQVPEGMEIDKENSTFECIKFRPKSLTYTDIQNKITGEKKQYETFVNCSKNNFDKLLVYRKLLEVADYLNNGWKPDWNDSSERKYALACDYYTDGKLMVTNHVHVSDSHVWFKSEKLARQAIKILGENTLKILFE